MRRVSTKRARLLRERKPVRDTYLQAHPNCEASLSGCTSRSTEVHEVLTRARGGSITDPENFRALCHSCHRWITEHPAWALSHGFMRSQFEREEVPHA